MTISPTAYKRDLVGSYIAKDPGATLAYSIDWSEWLAAGDMIDTSTWTQESVHTGGNLTLSSASVANNVTTILIADGAEGEIYTIRNTISTNENLTDVRRFRIRVEKRYV
jgi:hypothetical protein